MKKLLLILTFALFSFVANAKNDYYKCYGLDLLLKVEGKSSVTKRKLFMRSEGKWTRMCKRKSDEIRKDSFKCYLYNKDPNFKYIVFDEMTRKLMFYHKHSNRVDKFDCQKFK